MTTMLCYNYDGYSQHCPYRIELGRTASWAAAEAARRSASLKILLS